MYAVVKIVHSFWALLVLIILLLAVFNSIRGKVSEKAFDTLDLRISLFGLIFSHIQLLIGLILYFISPWFKKWSSLGIGVIKNDESRLYLIEHPLTNLLAIFLIRMGWSLHKRQTKSSKKFLRIAFFYGLGLLLLLIILPWNTWL